MALGSANGAALDSAGQRWAALVALGSAGQRWAALGSAWAALGSAAQRCPALFEVC